MQHENRAYVLQKAVVGLKQNAEPCGDWSLLKFEYPGFMTQRIPGTAGVTPASSDKFTQVTVGSFNSDTVAFNTSGRDAAVPVEC